MNAIALTLAVSSALCSPQDPHRAALPGAAEIAKLPADGGPEFNRLIFEKSPYLLQHARNSVEWFPWGNAAFELAREQDKPIFLSIGYSTCHWCHVMERESFEDAEVAALLNASFICIKLDREERPDVDQVYMTVTQTLTGSGGWPMTVVMTPEKLPFFAGTYFPKTGASGRPGMLELLPAIASAWKDERQAIEDHSTQLSTSLRASAARAMGDLPGEAAMTRAFDDLAQRFDAQEGGFATSLKFPIPHELRFLMRQHARGKTTALPMVELTLGKMARGGIRDHLGGGFHRYATDRQWLIPHFEKMLYDQALVALAYIEAFTLTGKAEYREIAESTLDYVRRDLSSPLGGFLCAEDADSEGEEGLFYLWTHEQLYEVLGREDGERFASVYGVTTAGNMRDHTGRSNGQNVLHLSAPWPEIARVRGEDLKQLQSRMAAARAKLFAAREKRVRPLRDDKLLTDWNGLAIAAFASAGRAFDRIEYVERASHAADFVLKTLRDDKGRLLKRYRDGEAAMPAVLDDYAFLVFGLIELYQSDFNVRWLREALRLNEEMLARFGDDSAGGFFLSASDGERLFLRAKEFYDGATPAGNSVAALNLLRLAHLTGDMSHAARAEKTLRAFAGDLARTPSGHTQALIAADFALGKASEIVIVGERGAADTSALVRALGGRFLPNTVVLLRAPTATDPIVKLAPYTAGQTQLDGAATAYLCRDFACLAPVNTVAAFEKLLDGP